MPRLKALVKISGNLIENPSIPKWLKKLTEVYHTVIFPGGGSQINEAFKKAGYEINFGLYGRETKTLEERQLARNILEINQAYVQDLLEQHGINAEVDIPVRYTGSVLSHVNGDLIVLEGLQSFEKIYVITEQQNVAKKKAFYDLFPKIEVLGLQKPTPSSREALPKKVAIVNVGEYGFTKRHTYNEYAEELRRFLDWNLVSAKTITALPTSLDAVIFDSFIFISRCNIDEAKKLKKEFKDKDVIVMTEILDHGDDDYGVVPMWKKEKNLNNTLLETIYPSMTFRHE